MGFKNEPAERSSEADNTGKCFHPQREVSGRLENGPSVQRDETGRTNSVDAQPRLAFVYGTLKRGFGNHWLMEELMAEGHARFVGVARTKQRFPLVCGPFQVPFLLVFPASGYHVRGELYQVDEVAVARLDELEGVNEGHYERLPVVITNVEVANAEWEISFGSSDLVAEAYFADSSFSHKMAGAPHIPCYTEEEASTYIRRKDRPQNRTFLEHVFAWIEEEGFTNPA